uniref:IgGFc_binding domain-containing protein n=1 Tax=Rhabditophanes sp. KR3021 TaxID=114890 RepID=A0AC35U269_9BILA
MLSDAATTTLTLDKNAVIQQVYNNDEGINDYSTTDFRIFVSCTEQVKLIDPIADPLYQWGDHFLIPSLKNAGSQYTFELQTAAYMTKGSIGILPINTEGSINVTILSYIDGALFDNVTRQYDTGLRSDQVGITTSLIDLEKEFFVHFNISISITTSSPVMLTFESSLASISHLYDQNSSHTPCVVPCAGSYMTVYDSLNSVQGTEQIVDQMGFTRISLMNTGVAAFSTYAGQMSTNRFGSIPDEDGIHPMVILCTMFQVFKNRLPEKLNFIQMKVTPI